MTEQSRIYRWEPDDETHWHDQAMWLKPDDSPPLEFTAVAQYWCGADGLWAWCTLPAFPPVRDGRAATADEAKRACELAVLHQEVR